LVPQDSDSMLSDPAWSPDGNSVIFGESSHIRLGTPHTAGFHLVDLKTHQASILPGSEGLCCPLRIPMMVMGDSDRIVMGVSDA